MSQREKERWAARIEQRRCPIEDCTGKLVYQSRKTFGAVAYVGQDRSRIVAHNPDYLRDEIEPFHVGCSGPVMHVWSKEDLFYLRVFTKPTILEST